MGNLKIEYTKAHTADQLHLKKVRNRYKINAELTVNQYQDRETNQYVIYIPSLDISGYGETVDKAREMIRFCINEFCEHISSLTPKKMESELAALGWKRDKIKNKRYSKAYVDISGELKNVAVKDTLEVNILTAA